MRTIFILWFCRLRVSGLVEAASFLSLVAVVSTEVFVESLSS